MQQRLADNITLLKCVLFIVMVLCCNGCDSDSHKSNNDSNKYGRDAHKYGKYKDNDDREFEFKTDYYSVFYWEKLWINDDGRYGDRHKFIGTAKGLLACKTLAMKHASSMRELWYCRAYSCSGTDGGVHRYEEYFGEEECLPIGNSANPNSPEYLGR
ncbi:hypothetical protein [Candidatus Fokinia crypta]|nr:hypothetical protein [Candidatus Fokinia cryptica]